MYYALAGQFGRYMGHVLKNVGGVYETPKSIEQTGEDVYEPTPKAIQQEAVAFLNKQLFETPEWLLNKEILNKISNPVTNEYVSNIQTGILNSLLSGARLNRLVVSANRYGDNSTYSLEDMINDVKKGIWNELVSNKPIDGYRRNLQKAYVDDLANILNPPPAPPANGFMVAPTTKNTDVASIARAQMVALRAQINSAIPGTKDKMSKYHLEDVSERIKKALDPKS